MGLETHEARWPTAFDHIECPVCGSGDWHHLPMQGVFCDVCNTEASLRDTAGDPGFCVDFDCSTVWTSTPKEWRLPPDGDGRRVAFAKYMGSEEGGYSRQYLSVSATYDSDAPAWVWCGPASTRDDTAEDVEAVA